MNNLVFRVTFHALFSILHNLRILYTGIQASLSLSIDYGANTPEGTKTFRVLLYGFDLHLRQAYYTSVFPNRGHARNCGINRLTI